MCGETCALNGRYIQNYNSLVFSPCKDDEQIIKEHIEYPLAVYAPYVNQRIKAQLGTFTLFGLDNKGKEVREEGSVIGKDYTDFSLYKIQEEYKDLCNKYKERLEYKPFLTEIKIDPEAKKEIADSLRALGVEKSNIYPELGNISADLMKEVKMYFDLRE